ncbi:GTP-binding protein [Saccharopolyspora sp. CA-218241]|uniref:GTP-binding protein n=1 Tax=Saccharopolyspora sp. CA-218241 TaxID=3240027 RepID=UPI003D951D16
MVSATSTPRADPALPATVTRSAKLVVAGPLGVGKTTFIGSISEIPPLRTEEPMTRAGEAVDDLTLTPDKRETTVAMDFGRLRLSSSLVLYLFGAPGQQRFHYLWPTLTTGAIGALLMVDTRRLDLAFDTLTRLEDDGLKFCVAVNRFPDSPQVPDEEVREALDLPAEVPLVTCDARRPEDCRRALITLVQHVHSELT